VDLEVFGGESIHCCEVLSSLLVRRTFTSRPRICHILVGRQDPGNVNDFCGLRKEEWCEALKTLPPRRPLPTKPTGTDGLDRGPC
jgi:hypothetical protein